MDVEQRLVERFGLERHMSAERFVDGNGRLPEALSGREIRKVGGNVFHDEVRLLVGVVEKKHCGDFKIVRIDRKNGITYLQLVSDNEQQDSMSMLTTNPNLPQLGGIQDHHQIFTISTSTIPLKKYHKGDKLDFIMNL